MKLGKAPRSDNITPEIIKYQNMGDEITRALRVLMKYVIKVQEVPRNWNIGFNIAN